MPTALIEPTLDDIDDTVIESVDALLVAFAHYPNLGLVLMCHAGLFSETVFAERMAIKLIVKAYAFDVRYEKALQSDIYQRVTKLFLENNISRPLIGVSTAWVRLAKMIPVFMCF